MKIDDSFFLPCKILVWLLFFFFPIAGITQNAFLKSKQLGRDYYTPMACLKNETAISISAGFHNGKENAYISIFNTNTKNYTNVEIQCNNCYAECIDQNEANHIFVPITEFGDNSKLKNKVVEFDANGIIVQAKELSAEKDFAIINLKSTPEGIVCLGKDFDANYFIFNLNKTLDVTWSYNVIPNEKIVLKDIQVDKNNDIWVLGYSKNDYRVVLFCLDKKATLLKKMVFDKAGIIPYKLSINDKMEMLISGVFLPKSINFLIKTDAKQETCEGFKLKNENSLGLRIVLAKWASNNSIYIVAYSDHEFAYIHHMDSMFSSEASVRLLDNNGQTIRLNNFDITNQNKIVIFGNTFGDDFQNHELILSGKIEDFLSKKCCFDKTNALDFQAMECSISPFELSLVTKTLEQQPTHIESSILDPSLNSICDTLSADFEFNIIQNEACVIDCDTLFIIDPLNETDYFWKTESDNTYTKFQTNYLNLCRPYPSSLIFRADRAGCINSKKITLPVDTSSFTLFPNAFTPNGDGINDLFEIIQPTNCPEINYELSIYNRWGSVVYEGQNKGWDGMVQDVFAPMEVYYFTAKVYLKDGQVSTQSGELILVR